MTRAKVLSLGEMADVERQLEPAFELVRGDAGLAAHGPAIRAIVTRGRDKIGEEMLARLPAVELIANFGVGYDSIDVEAARRHGVVVTNTPDVLNDEVADLSVALLLATVRQIPQAERYLRSGRWLSGNFPLGPTLRDRTVGLIGMGRIGRRIAQRLRAFDVPVVYHSRTPQADVPYKHYPDLRAMAAEVDTLLAIIPGGA
ncbi:MAG: NAD(P)-dependent oxidoreductase, partial [Myxococcales bacterium]